MSTVNILKYVLIDLGHYRQKLNIEIQVAFLLVAEPETMCLEYGFVMVFQSDFLKL